MAAASGMRVGFAHQRSAYKLVACILVVSRRNGSILTFAFTGRCSFVCCSRLHALTIACLLVHRRRHLMGALHVQTRRPRWAAAFLARAQGSHSQPPHCGGQRPPLSRQAR